MPGPTVMIAVMAAIEQRPVVEALARVPGMVRRQPFAAPIARDPAPEPVMGDVVEELEDEDGERRLQQQKQQRPAAEDARDAESERGLACEIPRHAIGERRPAPAG